MILMKNHRKHHARYVPIIEEIGKTVFVDINNSLRSRNPDSFIRLENTRRKRCRDPIGFSICITHWLRERSFSEDYSRDIQQSSKSAIISIFTTTTTFTNRSAPFILKR